jgi:hypothetical protein
MSKPDPSRFHLGAGTVQPLVSRSTPWFCHHFGRAEYDRDKPVVSDSIRQQAQPIIDELNAGTLTIEEAKVKLDKIWF